MWEWLERFRTHKSVAGLLQRWSTHESNMNHSIYSHFTCQSKEYTLLLKKKKKKTWGHNTWKTETQSRHPAHHLWKPIKSCGPSSLPEQVKLLWWCCNQRHGQQNGQTTWLQHMTPARSKNFFKACGRPPYSHTWRDFFNVTAVNGTNEHDRHTNYMLILL